VESEHGVSVAHDSAKDNRTVFVSNLNYSVDDTTIKEVFSSLGTITDLRLVKDFKGRSKGFCFVEFSSPVSSLLRTHIDVYSNRYMYSSHSYFIIYVPG
jgi:RNA recognition motif-containing protein